MVQLAALGEAIVESGARGSKISQTKGIACHRTESVISRDRYFDARSTVSEQNKTVLLIKALSVEACS